MDDFEKRLEHNLDYLDFVAVSDDYQKRQKAATDIEGRLRSATEHINACLARDVRRMQPALQASLASGLCTIGYKSKSLACKPCPSTEMWIFDDSLLSRRLRRKYPHCLSVSNNTMKLARAIVDIFNNSYKSLRKNQNISEVNIGPATKRRGTSKSGAGYYS